jgi:hypothetical protein
VYRSSMLVRVYFEWNRMQKELFKYRKMVIR